MRIIKATEVIPVEHPIFCLFGQPGICKSSLMYSAENPLLLDFDNGAHRAANRRDTLVINAWQDVDELMENPGTLDAYSTIGVDTVGRCLDLMSADIIEKTPKYGRDGGLTLQGFGALKSRFRTWMTQLRLLGKDVVLIAHHKEDKDGDTMVMRPDITGASYGEVMKSSDCVGYVSMVGKNRVIDFNPTDRWVGKNPANWKPMQVPAIGKAQDFLAGLIVDARAALGGISEVSAAIALQVDDWRALIQTLTNCAEFNRIIPDVKALSAIVQPQVVKLVMDGAAAKGIPFDKATKLFTHPVVPKPELVESFA